MGRDHVWKGKDPGFRRLLEEVAAEAEHLRVKGHGWRGDGLAEWPLSRVLWRLAELGIPCTKEESFQEALAADSEYALASLWALRLRAEGELREFLEHASVVVCAWHFPNGGGYETDFLIAADLAIEDECREEKHDEAQLRRRAEASLQVAKVASSARQDDPGGWVSMMEERCRVPVSIWAADLVVLLHAANLADQALALVDAWTPIALTERFRAEKPLILAMSGKKEEARGCVDALLRDYPRSLPSLFMAGEALVAMEERDEGYETIERAMALAQSREERLWIRDHLAGLAAFVDAERKEGPAPVFDEDDPIDDGEVATPIKAEARVGRNDPCPCGSGKKYKKCCGKGGG